MSQPITIWGGSYVDVPAVELPKTGGGTAKFTDVTDTTATASDVATGKYFYTASGVRTAGTSSGGGGGGDITLEVDENGYVILPEEGSGGGGSGFTTIASGTFVGSDNTQDAGRQQFSIGTKMAKTDFYILVTAPNGTEMAYSSMRKWVWYYAACYSDFGYYDLSTAGNKGITPSSYYIDSNNGGTITQRSCGDIIWWGKQLYNGAVSNLTPNQCQIRRLTNPDHFELYIGISNGSYIFPAEVTYNWKVVYFGSNPSEDIVDIS